MAVCLPQQKKKSHRLYCSRKTQNFSCKKKIHRDSTVSIVRMLKIDFLLPVNEILLGDVNK